MTSVLTVMTLVMAAGHRHAAIRVLRHDTRRDGGRRQKRRKDEQAGEEQKTIHCYDNFLHFIYPPFLMVFKSLVTDVSGCTPVRMTEI